MAEEASSSTSDDCDSCTYDVFLSFRGETRKSFTDYLYEDLKKEGFRTFRDKDDAERGKSLSLELKKAIQQSRSSIIVFSKDFASSTWCLDEVILILDRMKTSRHFVLPICYHVDPGEVRKQTESFATSFARYEEQIEKESNPRKKEELMDKVKEWRKALEEVAGLGAMVLENEADGYEAKFIKRIIKVMRDNVILKVPKVKSSQIGIEYRAAKIIWWLQNGSTDEDIMVISGISGIGKTTIAEYVFDLAFGRFGRNRFFENVSEISKQSRGFIQLREKLVPYYRGKKRKRGASHEDNGPPVFIVLDDVVNKDQLDAIPIMKECFHPGSKIIIVTTNMQLSRHYKVEYKVETMDDYEALELFSWHAFEQDHPIECYMDYSKRVVNFCEGHPLALKVLGSSLCAQTEEVWISQLMKFKAIPNSQIQEKLKVGYDRLQDDYNRDLFLEIACFFVGMDKDYVVAILEKCNFYSTAGIQDLVDRCLLTINENKFEMHKLLQQMGREIVRQQSPKCLGERSRLWQYVDSFRVLEEKSGTKTIEGLALNMKMLEKDEHAMESLNIENSKEATLDTDAFKEMRELRVLQIDHVQLLGGYKEFPKNLRWLCWHGFPLKCLPSDFPMKNLVAIDMRNSSLEKVWEGAKSLPCLKFLDLTDCHALTETPDFSRVPKLLNLILEGCENLVRIHESIEKLRKLVVLNLNGCKSLKKLPGGIGKLKSVKTFEISGCSDLENFPTELREMESLEVLEVKDIELSRRPMVTLPCSIKILSLERCNLSDCDFPKNLSSLPFLEDLSIAGNPICSLPDFVKGLDNLISLDVSDCKRLQTLTGLPPLEDIEVRNCTLLKKITYRSSLAGRLPCFDIEDCKDILEAEGFFKVEPLANFDAKMTNNLGLLNVESLRSTEVELFNNLTDQKKKLPIQVLFEHNEEEEEGDGDCGWEHEDGYDHKQGYDVISIFLPGRNNWSTFSNCFTFSKQNAGGSSISFQNAGGYSISFIVPPPPVHNLRAHKLSIWCVYSNIFDGNVDISRFQRNFETSESWDGWFDIRIYNNTENEKVEYEPTFFGIPERGKCMTWLSHFNLNLQFEPGNELLIEIKSDYFEIEEVRVHLAYDDHEESDSQSSRESSRHLAFSELELGWVRRYICSKQRRNGKGQVIERDKKFLQL